MAYVRRYVNIPSGSPSIGNAQHTFRARLLGGISSKPLQSLQLLSVQRSSSSIYIGLQMMKLLSVPLSLRSFSFVSFYWLLQSNTFNLLQSLRPRKKLDFSLWVGMQVFACSDSLVDCFQRCNICYISSCCVSLTDFVNPNKSFEQPDSESNFLLCRM